MKAEKNMSDWRELARQNVPFDQWPLDAKMAAVQDHTAAVFRSTPTVEDWELFKLQHPYVAQFAQFITTITMTNLTPDEPQPPTTARATFTGPFQYEAPAGSRTRWGAVVSHSGMPANGDAIFELFGSLGQVDLKRIRLNSGSASYTTVSLPPAQYMLRARYEPLDSGLTPSAQLVFLTVH
ncbi:hypothetical protein AB0K48_10170 [Nonomuraea sp. NPDC055795]